MSTQPGEWDSPKFVDVVVEATGRVETVPAEWVGHPVLGAGLQLVPAAAGPVDPASAPTVRDKVEVIDEFAAAHGIDLGDASTKAEKVAVIDQALAAAIPPAPVTAAGSPDVVLVAGDESDASPYPYIEEQRNTDPSGGAGPSDESPDAGNEEN